MKIFLNKQFDVIAFFINDEQKAILITQHPLYQLEVSPKNDEISLKLFDTKEIICKVKKTFLKWNLKEYEVIKQSFLIGTCTNLPKLLQYTIRIFEEGMMYSV